MYVVIGATGNVGSKVAESLLTAGKKVRVIGRDGDRLKQFVDLGAEAVAGSVEDAAFLTRVLEDARALFAMIPTDVTVPSLAGHQDLIGEAISSALSSAKVPHVVNLSSLGADRSSGNGPIAGLHRQEQRLNQLKDARVVHLRPTYFMENFLSGIPMIKNMGFNGDALRPDLSLPCIATRDIAEVAASLLLTLDFPERQVRELLGPRNYTPVEATRILGNAIGKPDLAYVQFSYEDLEQGLIAAGLSPDVAREYRNLETALNDGLADGVERNANNTTPTTMEQFATLFAEVYNKS